MNGLARMLRPEILTIVKERLQESGFCRGAEFLLFLRRATNMSPTEADEFVRLLIAQGILLPASRITSLRDAQFKTFPEKMDTLVSSLSELAQEDSEKDFANSQPVGSLPSPQPEGPTNSAPSFLKSEVLPVLSIPPEIAPPRSLFRYETQLEAFKTVISAAKNDISIFSPFMDRTGVGMCLTELVAAMRRGVRVRLISRSDNNLRLDAYQFLDGVVRQEGLQPRLEIREYRERANMETFRLHAKLILADDAMSYLGSGELRLFSLLTNIELGVLLTGEPVKLHRAIFNAVWDASKNADRSK